MIPQVHEKDWNVRVHVDTAPWPPYFAIRRAGVSSVGYGATNGHVIVESVDYLYPRYSHGLANKLARYDHSYGRPLLICLSAHDRITL